MKYFRGTSRKSPQTQPGVGIKAVVVSGLKCILPSTTRVDHPPTSQLIEERILLQLLAKRKVQALRAQGAVGLEVHWAHVARRSDSGKERSSVTGNK